MAWLLIACVAAPAAADIQMLCLYKCPQGVLANDYEPLRGLRVHRSLSACSDEVTAAACEVCHQHHSGLRDHLRQRACPARKLPGGCLRHEPS